MSRVIAPVVAVLLLGASFFRAGKAPLLIARRPPRRTEARRAP